MIVNLVKKAVEALSEPLNFQIGDLIELSNKSNNSDFPIFAIDENFTIEIMESRFAKYVKYGLSFSILYQSDLDNIAEDRLEYFVKAENQLRQLIDIFNRAYIGLDNSIVIISRGGMQVGRKVVKEIVSNKAIRVKNIFDSNADGIMVTSFQITLYDYFDYCNGN